LVISDQQEIFLPAKPYPPRRHSFACEHVPVTRDRTHTARLRVTREDGVVAPTFVYDGDCAFCSACARFIERHVPSAARVVPWQFADLDALGLSREQCERAVQWVDGDAPPAGPTRAGPTPAGPDAIARLLLASRPYWRVAGWILALRPVRAAAWPAYRWVARNRHRMPGGTASCDVGRLR
jgi:predicted DCC family thiol-disulfide oxidoreductase YuxK